MLTGKCLAQDSGEFTGLGSLTLTGARVSHAEIRFPQLPQKVWGSEVQPGQGVSSRFRHSNSYCSLPAIYYIYFHLIFIRPNTIGNWGSQFRLKSNPLLRLSSPVPLGKLGKRFSRKFQPDGRLATIKTPKGGVAMAELRDYQSEALARVVAYARNPCPRRRFLVASPTGTGKSYVMLAAQDALPGAWIVTTGVSIVWGMLRKLGESPSSESDLWRRADSRRITTPVRFRNRLLAGSIDPASIPCLLLDEAHHDNAETHQQLHALCDLPAIGFTGTPFRGTPQGTFEFRSRWGEPYWMLTIKQAIERGIWTVPECQTWPLVDDDEVEVSGGQLVANQIEAKTKDKLEHLADLLAARGVLIRPGLVITMPGAATAHAMVRCLAERRVVANVITDETPWKDRERAFRMLAACPIIQVRTIGEGTDLEGINVMVDAAPTLSPVLWLQRFGRLTGRSSSPLYICTNRNYQRHCYLLEGACPEIYLRDSVKVFGGLSERAGYRAFGLQTLGRLKAVKVNTTRGLQVHCYAVGAVEGNTAVDYFVIVHPSIPKPLWFAKRSGIDRSTQPPTRIWGEWEHLPDPPTELKGYKSARPNPLTKGQEDWWYGREKFQGRGADKYGIDPTQKVDARIFQVLPVLAKVRRAV